MAKVSEAGDVYLLDQGGSVPHYHIIVYEPVASDDRYVVTSFTDAEHQPLVKDLWVKGTLITSCGRSLTKDSKIAINRTSLRDADWVKDKVIAYVGKATDDVLQRVRDNLSFHRDQVRPPTHNHIKIFFGWEELEDDS